MLSLGSERTGPPDGGDEPGGHVPGWLAGHEPPRDTDAHVGEPAGSGITGGTFWIAVGQTTRIFPLTYCITTGVERSFWPESCAPGGKNFTP